VNELPFDEIEKDAKNIANRILRCDAHPRGSILNPVSFNEFSEGSTEVFIEFSSQLYRLSRTRLGKLILIKATNGAVSQIPQQISAEQSGD